MDIILFSTFMCVLLIYAIYLYFMFSLCPYITVSFIYCVCLHLISYLTTLNKQSRSNLFLNDLLYHINYEIISSSNSR